jgi:TorA maturation chaperone TorD
MEHDNLFRFLSLCFTYPNDDRFQALADTLSLLATDLEIEQSCADTDTPLSIEDMQAEYVRLFINGPGGVAAPPYASVYINHTGLLRQQGFDEALAMYRRAGLEPDSSDDLPDHIRYELAFIALLLERGDHDRAEEFIDRHLGRWFPRFANRLLSAEPHPFYHTLGRATDLCLKQTLKEVFA